MSSHTLDAFQGSWVLSMGTGTWVDGADAPRLQDKVIDSCRIRARSSRTCCAFECEDAPVPSSPLSLLIPYLMCCRREDSKSLEHGYLCMRELRTSR